MMNLKIYFSLLFTCGYLLLSAQKFEFALIGDMPYQEKDVVKFKTLVKEINQDRKIKWVMHTGDIKTGNTPCTDDYFQSRYQLYQSIEKPFIFIPGDNEWTDCHRNPDFPFDPLERLEAIRQLFYPNPNQSLGKKPMNLESQSKQKAYAIYKEHQRWEKNGVWFVTCHMVGSANGLFPFEKRTKAHDEEVKARIQAAITWLKETFQKAKEDKGIFVMIHANPIFELGLDTTKNPGFANFLDVLEQETIAFGKPVVLAHGDSHYFRYDKPMLNRKTGKRIENFTRLENFGDGDIHWVRVLVNPKDPNVFNIRQELVIDNFEDHKN